MLPRRDFSHAMYVWLLAQIRDSGFEFTTFQSHADHLVTAGRYLILRHDVDRLARRALAIAQLEHEMGIQATYFFRAKTIRNQPEIIDAIARLGHFIGYHYEDLAQTRGDRAAAWRLFGQNLADLRVIAPVELIAMHGRPLSPIDSRDLWQDYDYQLLDIRMEVYLDIDYKMIRYFTDTGGCWNHSANLRDRPPGYHPCPKEQALHSTADLQRYLTGQTYFRAILSAHPERWGGHLLAWTQARTQDHVFNLIKRTLVLLRSSA